MLLCLGPVRTQQSFNKWSLEKLNSAVHKNTGNFASLTKRARSTSLLLISSVNVLLHSKKRKKKPEMGDFYVSKLLFLRVQVFSLHLFALRYQIPWPNCLTKFGYMTSRCSILDVTFCCGLHRELTTITPVSFNFFFSLYLSWDQPNILAWSHHQASSNDEEKGDCVA